MSKRFVLILILFFYFNTSFSQSGSLSPYSRYGIGDIQFTGFTSQLAMGGLSIAQNDSFSLNFNNPASYASLRLTVFDGAVRGEYNRYAITNVSGERNNGGMSYLAIGFPLIYKKWGTSVGLIPYSSTGYNLQTSGIISDSVTYYNFYSGSGGLSRLYWGNGFQVSRNLSLGFNASYFFGSINRTRNTEFSQNSYYNSSSNVTTMYSNLITDFGGLFKTDSLFFIKKKGFTTRSIRDSITPAGDTIKVTSEHLPESLSHMAVRRLKAARWLRLNIGVTGAYSNKLTEHNDVLEETYKNFGGVASVRDTLLYEPNQKIKTNLPAYINIGIALQDQQHWLIGFDAGYQQWSKFRQSDLRDSLEDAFRFSLGGEITPKYNAPNFWKRVTYRAGIRYGRSQLNLRNTPINEYAFTFGFGLPIRKDNVTAAFGNYFSRLNLSFELGQRGTTNNDLLREQYLRVNIGLNLTELWFIKKKYD